MFCIFCKSSKVLHSLVHNFARLLNFSIHHKNNFKYHIIQVYFLLLFIPVSILFGLAVGSYEISQGRAFHDGEFTEFEFGKMMWGQT